MDVYRQGDVLIVRVEDPKQFPQSRGIPLYRQPGEGLILAEGEATGHAHRVRSTRARLRRHTLTIKGQRVRHTCLYVPPSGAVVEHEEHAPINLEPGVYEVKRQSEYAPTVRERKPSERGAAARSWVAD